eukprot:scaffold373041_cov83-Cyclotella_meneghiniana.AAC.4
MGYEDRCLATMGSFMFLPVLGAQSVKTQTGLTFQEDSVKTVETEDESTMNKITEPKGAKLFSAMLCCYTAFDFDDPVLLGRQRNDCICINQRACLDLSADSLGVGCLNGDKKDDNEYCKLGAYCCTCALAKPELRCDGIGQRFCCFPVFGCCNDAPECPAEENLRLVGGGVVTTHSLARDMIRSHKMNR